MRGWALVAGALMPRLTEKAVSIGVVVLALAVLVRGNVYAALVIFAVSLWLLGRSTRPVDRPGRDRVARVRSRRIEMDLHRDSGVVTGRILDGSHAGRRLDALDRHQCEAIYAACLRDDGDGARLLETYLNRRFPGWRPAGDAHGDARREQPRGAGGMSQEEAYQILGLSRGAARDEIVRAHRAAMKRWHPDQGGSAALAARANEAKEVLLGRPG